MHKAFWKEFWEEEMGQDMAEYSLLLAGMVVAVAAGLVTFKSEVTAIFNSANSALATAAAG